MTACSGRTQPADVQQRLDSQHTPAIPEGEAVWEQDREGSPCSAQNPVDSEGSFSERISAQEINDLLQTARNARQVLTDTRCGRPVDLAGVATRLKISTFHQQYSWRTHLQDIMARVAEARRLEEARREEDHLQASLLHKEPSTVEPRPYTEQLESPMAPQRATTPQPEQSVLLSQAQAQQLPSSLLDTVRAKQFAALQHSAGKTSCIVVQYFSACHQCRFAKQPYMTKTRTRKSCVMNEKSSAPQMLEHLITMSKLYFKYM